MAIRQSMSGSKKACKGALSALLCGLIGGQPMLGQGVIAGQAAGKAGRHGAGQMTQDERVLHALNRLTFGPAPGEVAAVEKMGLRAWFTQQLNPGSIDDSALEARLEQYPAMKLSIAELQAKYPGPQLIKAMMNGKLGLPHDPEQKKLVEVQIALYKRQKAKQEAAKSPEAANAMQSVSATKPDAGDGEALTAEKPVSASELAPEPAPGDPDTTASRELAQRLLGIAPERRMQAIVAMDPEEMVKLRQGLKGGELLKLMDGMSPEDKEAVQALGGSLKMVGLEEMESRLERDIYSKRQLEAVMTDFWLNHFNVYVRKNQNEAYLIPTYERETIRKNALGNFENLLVATAMSPAMLEYLDNFRSIGPNLPQVAKAKRFQENHPFNQNRKNASAGLNENYGRELMELHTLGVNGGYTQADVTNVAKVFTGWTIDKPYQPGGGQFIFDENRHEPGAKVVLGKTIHEDGYKEGLEVLHMLAQSPATAHFVSQKLAVRFVSDEPPAALVDRMAAAYLSSHGDIKTVLAAMWNSPEFWSEDVYRAKVKTPEEFVVSAARASGADVVDAGGLVQSLNKLGMPLYGMQTPQGYSWKKDDWVSTGALVSRMNFALVLAGDRVPGTQIGWGGMVGEGSVEVLATGYSSGDAGNAKERRLETGLIGQPVSERTRAAVLSQAKDESVTEQAETQFDLRGGGREVPGMYRQRRTKTGAQAGPDDAQAAVMAGLLLGSPEFQRR